MISRAGRCVAVVTLVLLAWMGASRSGAAPAVKAPPPAAKASTSASSSAGPKPLADTLTGDARADYESGKQLYGVQDFVTAKVKFQSAYDKSKDPRLLWNMAACERQMKHYAKARALVRRYLDEGGTLLTAQDRQDAESFLQATESLVVPVKIEVDPAGASIWIDDEPVGTSPLPGPMPLDIGTRKLRVKKDGFKEHTSSPAIGSEKDQTLTVKLEPEAHEGALAVHAPKDATISIDGTEVGTGNWSGKLKSGGHTLRVTARGKRTYQSELTLLEGENRSVDVVLEAAPEPPPPEGPEEWRPWVTFGARGTIGVMLRHDQPLMWATQLEAGIHVTRWLVLAPYFFLGGMSNGSGCGFGLNTEDKGDGAPQYDFPHCGFVKPGAALIAHLRRSELLDPWVSLDFGTLLVSYDWRRVDSASKDKSQKTATDAYFMGGLGAGLDIRPFAGFRAFTIGPFLLFSTAFGVGEGAESFDLGNNLATKKPKTLTSGVRVAFTL